MSGGIKKKSRSEMTESQLTRLNEIERKKYLIRQLRQGRVPKPRRPAPWLSELYQQFGVTDNDVFMPKLGMPDIVNKKARRRFKYEKYEKSRRSDTLSLTEYLIRAHKRIIREGL